MHTNSYTGPRLLRALVTCDEKEVTNSSVPGLSLSSSNQFFEQAQRPKTSIPDRG